MQRVLPFFVASFLALLFTGYVTTGEAGGVPEEQFCGMSTGSTCSSDQDCVRAGCSKQVCQSAAEPGKMTTCEFRECYDPVRYGLSCACVNGGCGWAKQVKREE
jgi:eight-cysteine-cluster-containing protein